MNDLVSAKFYYSGQTCVAPKRIFIHRSIYDEFLQEFRARVRALVVGAPEDGRTDVSPVASSLAVNRIREQLADGVQKGAKIVQGGEIVGNLIYPTIVRDATDAMLGMQEEFSGRWHLPLRSTRRTKFWLGQRSTNMDCALPSSAEKKRKRRRMSWPENATVTPYPSIRSENSERLLSTSGAASPGAERWSPSRSAVMDTPAGFGKL
jgi:aldehyde dehydrogenase family protein